MVESAIILGADRHEAETQMLDVLNFETQLANVSSATSSTSEKANRNEERDLIINRMLINCCLRVIKTCRALYLFSASDERQPAATTPETDH